MVGVHRPPSLTPTRAPTCDKGSLCGRLLKQDHVLQKGVVCRTTVPLQGRGSQVRGQVGAREEGDPLLQARERKPFSVLLGRGALESRAKALRLPGPQWRPHAMQTHRPVGATYSGRACSRKSQGNVGQGWRCIERERGDGGFSSHKSVRQTRLKTEHTVTIMQSPARPRSITCDERLVCSPGEQHQAQRPAQQPAAHGGDHQGATTHATHRGTSIGSFQCLVCPHLIYDHLLTYHKVIRRKSGIIH